jgi:hypothetical protein
MQRRDDEYRRMWADEKARVHQVVDEYRRRFEQVCGLKLLVYQALSY